MFKNFKKNNKGQEQVITIVLLILLVLTIVFILWGVVSRTVSEGGEEIETQSSCVGVLMEITNAVNGSNNITIRRGPGDSDSLVTGYKIFINGRSVNDSSNSSEIIVMRPLDTIDVSWDESEHGTLALRDKVEVAAIVYDSVCSPSYTIVEDTH